MLVIGPRDMEAGNVSLRLHGKGNQGAKPKDEVIADILAAIRERRPVKRSGKKLEIAKRPESPAAFAFSISTRLIPAMVLELDFDSP